jgi:hypothetical protein
MRETKFSIDLLGDRDFDGYTTGETWNGWACPFFTFEQAQQLVKVYQENGLKAWYDEASDAFSFEVDAGGGLKELDTFPAEEIDSKKYYPVGASCWIWEESSEGVGAS